MSTISRGKSGNNLRKKKKLRLDAKFWARIMVIVLIVAMLAGSCYYALVFLLADSRVDAASPVSTDDMQIRVALVYGSSVTVDFKTVTDNGFSLGYNDSKNNFTEITSTDVPDIRVVCNRNLSLCDGRYTVATAESEPDIGAYNISIKCENEIILNYLPQIKEALFQYNVYTGYIENIKYILIGQFNSVNDASSSLSDIVSVLLSIVGIDDSVTTEESSDDLSSDTFESTIPSSDEPIDTTAKDDLASDNNPSESLSQNDTEPPVSTENVTDSSETSNETSDIIETSDTTTSDNTLTESDIAFANSVREASVLPLSDTAVMVADPLSNKLIWIFDNSSGSSFMAVKAIQKEDKYSYISGCRNGNMYKYDGTLECSVYNNDSSYGIKVINVLPVEKYICGVIPYEIGNSWPLETQKAFAIAVRSYALSHLGRHKNSYNADICCTAHCQVYKGFGSTNDLVRRAVEETKGLIAVYDGKICETFYSSSTGGCTANVSEVWGSNQKYYGYLRAVATPWERYEKYGNGSWTSTATGEQLYQRLKAKGYTGLKSAVTKIEILKYGVNSSYVYSIKFYDAGKNSVTVSRIDKVKSLLSPYVKSGNFVVGKAGEKITRTNFTMMGFGGVGTEPATGVSVKTNPFDYLVLGRQPFTVLTAKGVQTFIDSNSEYVATAGGTVNFNMSQCLDSQYFPTVSGVNGEVLPDILNLDTIVETETIIPEGKDGTFVFIGRGWGHGVGLSQWGIKDIGDLGYDYLTIFKSYYTGAEIISYSDYLNNY